LGKDSYGRVVGERRRLVLRAIHINVGRHCGLLVRRKSNNIGHIIFNIDILSLNSLDKCSGFTTVIIVLVL